MLADTYNMQRYYRFADARETRAKGLDAATKALELDATTPEAYIAMANLQYGGKEGIAGSKRLLEKAIELSPYNSTARLRYGWVILHEDLRAASEQMRLAQEFDPVSAITNGAYCNMLIFERKFGDAVRYCEKARDISPETVNTIMMLADAYFLDGRHADALATIQKAISQAKGREQLSAMGSLAYYYLRLGRRAEADPIIARLKSEVEKGQDILPDMIILSFEIGRRDEAIKYFEQAYEQQRIGISMLNHSPIWERVNADPGVSEIMKRPRPSQ